MRIMLIAPEMIDTHTRRFIEMLLGARYIVICVSIDNPKPEGDERFTFIKYPEVYFSKRIKPKILRRALTEWGKAFRLRQIWQKVKPDIVHVLYINLQAYHSALARLNPLVLTALGSDINIFFETGNSDVKRRKKITKALLTADHITADTHEVLDRCEILSNRQLNSSLFFFGIDLNLFKPQSTQDKGRLRQRLGIPNSSKIILSPRRLVPKMKHDLILRAFAELKKTRYFDTVIIFRRFGFHSEIFEKIIRELAVDLGISDQVIWMDEMNYTQLPVLYSLADMIINFPEQDGLPVTLFEASACKTPIITCNLPSYREFLIEGTYYRVGVGDVKGLEDAMKSVLDENNDDMTGNLQKSYNLVFDKADQVKCFSIIEQIYQEFTNN
ncbi:MAG: glycosyltransferase family 4 protein [Chloroflexi bacterium]|nr:glycosyltransferase family 4 protein [Chloroflexota bacterium]